MGLAEVSGLIFVVVSYRIPGIGFAVCYESGLKIVVCWFVINLDST